MSVTGHNDVRRAGDFYPTPAWVTRALVPLLPTGGSVLDPCAGEGAILSTLAASSLQCLLHGYEIDGERARAARGLGLDVLTCDSLASEPWVSASAVVMNPPFSLAQPFVERALREAPIVAALLRLNWLAGLKRVAFHRAHPADVHVLPRRPSFTGKGTDACEYAWFIWSPNGGGRWSVLDLTPEETPTT